MPAYVWDTGESSYRNLTTNALVSSNPPGWQLLYSTTFATNDGWTLRQETQNNDNSYNHPDNVEFGPNGLTIIGRRENRGGRPYTSGDIQGLHVRVPNYFRAEIVATVPTDYGMWPAPLWFRPQDGYPHGEIDVCETWPHSWPTARYGVALHRDYSLTPRLASAYLDYSMLANADPAAEHTYTVVKTERRIEFLCDGVRAYCWENNTPWSGANRIGSVPDWYDAYFETPEREWYPRINLQIGSGPDNQAPNPEETWMQSEINVRSLKIWAQED